jgi:hypothetical protein
MTHDPRLASARSPVALVLFTTRASIGDRVSAGQPVAAIDGTVLAAPLAGVLWGLTHDGVRVTAHTKVIEVDCRRVHRCNPRHCMT